jgi:hypothetical protein
MTVTEGRTDFIRALSPTAARAFSAHSTFLLNIGVQRNAVKRSPLRGTEPSPR